MTAMMDPGASLLILGWPRLVAVEHFAISALAGRPWLEACPQPFDKRPESVLLVVGDNLDFPDENKAAARVRSHRQRMLAVASRLGVHPSVVHRVKISFDCPWADTSVGNVARRVTPLSDTDRRWKAVTVPDDCLLVLSDLEMSMPFFRYS